jgi:hypothetical protein
MANRDREWPGNTQWYCCAKCHRLWTYQGQEVVALDSRYALAPARPSDGVPIRTCTACLGELTGSVAEI